MHLIWKYKLDHIAFWLITILFYAFTRQQEIIDSGGFTFLYIVLLRNLLLALACYTNIYVLFPRFFRKGFNVEYVFSLLLVLTLYTLAQNAVDFYIDDNRANLQSENKFFSKTFFNFSVGVFYVAFTLALDLSKRWYQQQLLLHQIQTEKLETELQYLKGQLNPHFLFNSLNTIYFQINKENNIARESLGKFSELLRYQLYECNGNTIPIDKEINYLSNYVDLQRMRKDLNNEIDFRVSPSVKNFIIAPLLLIPFVENAFKHLSVHENKRNFISIFLDYQDKYFVFQINNSISPESSEKKHTGIGLKNVQRRLDLLYPEQYKLEFEHTGELFSVNLLLKIS